MNDVLRGRLVLVRTFMLGLLVYLVARCTWDWKKLSRSGHLGDEMMGILIEGAVATAFSFYLGRRRRTSLPPDGMKREA